MPARWGTAPDGASFRARAVPGHDGTVTRGRTGPLELPGAVVRWGGSALRELAYAPDSISRLRRLLLGVSELPDQLERVVGAVESTTAPLSSSLEDVAEALAEIRDRLEHLDSVIWHLRDTLVALIAAVPGAGRVLDRLPPPPPPGVMGRRPAGAVGSAGSPAPEPADDESARQGERT